MASKVKDGKIIKSLKKGNFYDDLKKKYNVKKLKNADANKKAREKNYKNFNFKNNPEFALSLLPAGKILSKIPGVKKSVSKLGELAKTAFRSKTNTSQGQGGGQFNPPAVRPNKTISSKPNKPNAQIVKSRNTDVKKPSNAVVNKPNNNKVNTLGPIRTIRGGNTRLAGPLLSSILAKQALATNKNKIEKKEDKKPIKEKEIKIKKSTTPIVKKETLKSKPRKKTNITAGGNTGFGAKGNVFVSSEKRRKELMDKYGGTGSKAAKAAMAGTQGNMTMRASGGGNLKSVPAGNTGLGKLPTPVRNKMGFMKKGGIVKMKGGGAATRGMNFNRGY